METVFPKSVFAFPDDKILVADWHQFNLNNLSVSTIAEKIVEFGQQSDKTWKLYLFDPEEGELLDVLIDAKEINNDSNYIHLFDFGQYFDTVFYCNANYRANKQLKLIKRTYLDKFHNWESGPFYPYELLTSYIFEYQDHPEEYSRDVSNIDKHFVSLNAVPKPERIVILDHLLNYADQLVYSWQRKNYREGQIFHYWNDKPINCKHFDPKQIKLLDYDLQYDGSQQWRFAPHYWNCAIDVFAESNPSNPECLFITEKTWRPFLFGKVFLGFNSDHYYEQLETLGFNLYHDIIDYSFDNITDNAVRMDAFCKEIDRLANIPLETLKNKILGAEEMIQHNMLTAQQLPYTKLPHELKKFKDIFDIIIPKVYHRTRENLELDKSLSSVII